MAGLAKHWQSLKEQTLAFRNARSFSTVAGVSIFFILVNRGLPYPLPPKKDWWLQSEQNGAIWYHRIF